MTDQPTPEERKPESPESAQARRALIAVRDEVAKAVVGQEGAVSGLMVALLARGHVLLEGVPGVAKTLLIRSLAAALDVTTKRVQFTPDLMPGDLTGSLVFDSRSSDFVFREGPVFTNLLLADEINRTPPKTQSALLEAMEERQVTVGQATHKLPDPFMVLATQNPIEQEGTYPLPEAQTDRFLMKVLVGYPAPADETAVLRLIRGEERAALAEAPAGGENAPQPAAAPIALDDVRAARREIADIHVAEAIETYIIDLVNATRQPGTYAKDLAREIELGASPRAGLALDRCGRAHAWLKGQDFVSPGDIQAIAPDVLRHRVGLSYEATGAGRDADAVLADLIKLVAVT